MRPRKAAPTWLDKIESALAQWTRRSAWPSTLATIESQLDITTSNAQGRSSGSSFIFFSYEVEGQPFTAAVRQVLRQRNRFARLPEPARIQYNPDKPQQVYYAPACNLANVLIMLLLLIALPSLVFFLLHPIA